MPLPEEEYMGYYPLLFLPSRSLFAHSFDKKIFRIQYSLQLVQSTPYWHLDGDRHRKYSFSIQIQLQKFQ